MKSKWAHAAQRSVGVFQGLGVFQCSGRLWKMWKILLRAMPCSSMKPRCHELIVVFECCLSH